MCIVELKSPGAMLRTGFWLAPRRQTQTMEDKHLLLYLLTSPERTPIGLFPLNVAISAARVGWDKQQFLSVLNRLVRQSEISVQGYWVLVHTWWDHNSKPGPGFENQITALLDEAPTRLIEKWEELSLKAKILPFSWSKAFAQTSNACPEEKVLLTAEIVTPAVPSPPGTLPGTPPGTPGTRGGNYNANNKKNQIEKEKTDKKLNVKFEHIDCIVGSENPNDGQLNTLLASLPKIQKADFLQTCNEMGLSNTEARQLAYEFSARQFNEASPLEIKHPKKWLQAVVNSSRSTGHPISNRSSTDFTRVKDLPDGDFKGSSNASEIAKKTTREVNSNGLATEVLGTLTDIQIDSLRTQTLELIAPSFRSKFTEEVTTKLQQRSLPTGLAGSATKRALLTLGYVDEDWRSEYLSGLGSAKG